jgi:hypothetical protein
VALENARNHKRNIAFARVQQDLDAARLIQRSLLPQELPIIDGYSVAFRSVTCYEVGGDYLDIVEQPDGSLLLAVADVAGKGLASAIMATSFRSAFRGMALPAALDELATRMNQHHWAEGDEARRRYVTAIFLRLDPASRRHGGGQRRPQSRVPVGPGRCAEVQCRRNAAGPDSRHAYSIERAVFSLAHVCFSTPTALLRCSRGDEEFGRNVFWMNFLSARARKPMVFSMHCGIFH